MTISLKKKGDFHTIDLSKKSSQQLSIQVNLNWNQCLQKTNLLTDLLGINQPPDLDLGCMYETVDGLKGVIQPLGNSFGSKNNFPYIWLDKDDRTGAAKDGENMTVYRPETIKRILFFALIYQGAKDFQSVDGRMFFKVSNGERVSVELNNPDVNRSFCAAATIINHGSTVEISKEEKYFTSHQSADEHYGFGFNWIFGCK